MEKILLGYCPLCGDRYLKTTLQERNHLCLELDSSKTPSLDGAVLDGNKSVSENAGLS